MPPLAYSSLAGSQLLIVRPASPCGARMRPLLCGPPLASTVSADSLGLKAWGLKIPVTSHFLNRFTSLQQIGWSALLLCVQRVSCPPRLALAVFFQAWKRCSFGGAELPVEPLKLVRPIAFADEVGGETSEDLP